MRLALLLVAIAGCGRIHFADGAIDGGDGDAVVDPLALTCNRAVRVVDGSSLIPHLVGLASSTQIGAAWIDDDGAIRSGGATFATDTQLANPTAQMFPSPGEPFTAVSVASTGSTFLTVAGVPGGGVVRLHDITTNQPVASDLMAPEQISGAHAATATGLTSGTVYAFAGTDSAGDSNLVGVNNSNQITGGVNAGFQDSYVGLMAMNGYVVLSFTSTDSAQCEIDAVSIDFQSTGTLVGYGGPDCRQPITAHASGRSDFLLLHNDASTSSIVGRIATLVGADVVLGASSDVAAGSEPRAVATPTGYWSTYHYSGTIRAKHLSFTGVEDTDMLVATVVDDTSHDVVEHNGQAYAVWLDDGVYVQRLCTN